MNNRLVTKQFIICMLVSLMCYSCQPLSPDRIQPAKTLPATTPWDLIALSRPPQFHWVDQDSDIRSLIYEGPHYQGRPTEVFAYYATPATLQKNKSITKQYPAVVLVHGGGGQAYAEWVRLWAERGYVAIAMDLRGNGKDKKRLPNGGPEQSDDEIFFAVEQPFEDQWPYHAVSNIILAHSLIRTFREVNRDRTAITGISWGGYLTCIIAGLDNRFKAAVPVYGCGYPDPNSVWKSVFEKMTPDQRSKWTRLWDPSRYVGSAAMPMFFVNGTNDFAYWLESYSKTYCLVKSPKTFRITINMPHGHPSGWEPIEIGLFIDQYLTGGTPLAKISLPQIINHQIVADIITKTPITVANLHYTEDTAANTERKWMTAPLKVNNSMITGPPPPTDTKIWFLTAVDSRSAITSSPLIFSLP